MFCRSAWHSYPNGLFICGDQVRLGPRASLFVRHGTDTPGRCMRERLRRRHGTASIPSCDKGYLLRADRLRVPVPVGEAWSGPVGAVWSLFVKKCAAAKLRRYSAGCSALLQSQRQRIGRVQRLHTRRQHCVGPLQIEGHSRTVWAASATSLHPVVRLGDNVELRRQRRVRDLPALDFQAKQANGLVGVLIEPVNSRAVRNFAPVESWLCVCALMPSPRVPPPATPHDPRDRDG